MRAPLLFGVVLLVLLLFPPNAAAQDQIFVEYQFKADVYACRSRDDLIQFDMWLSEPNDAGLSVARKFLENVPNGPSIRCWQVYEGQIVSGDERSRRALDPAYYDLYPHANRSDPIRLLAPSHLRDRGLHWWTWVNFLAPLPEPDCKVDPLHPRCRRDSRPPIPRTSSVPMTILTTQSTH